MVQTRRKNYQNSKKIEKFAKDYENGFLPEFTEEFPKNEPNIEASPNNWRKDKHAISILIFLYILQGIPLGLCGSIPYILTNRGISYEAQALFSFTFWPFSLKLLWAPFVDGLYSKKFGRRKSWLLPVQYSLGLIMLFLSYKVESLLQGSIMVLTIYFFCLNFLAATQDIAVDGWCLTMLSKENVGWASTCNTVGQTAGYFLGNIVFLALESTAFSNNYLRPILNLPLQDHGVVTLSRFMYFWGIVFIIGTTLVGLLKSEKEDNDDKGVVETYLVLWKVIKKRLILIYIAFALTSRIGLSAVDGITGLKLIEKGVPKENIALMAIPLTPLQIILPLVISKYTAGPRPLSVWVKVYVPRILFGSLLALTVYQASVLGTKSTDREIGLNYPIWWYIWMISIYALHQIVCYCNFVSIMAFNAKISDPEIGGTYMTLLNTVTNLGGNWPSTLALYFVDKLSKFNCIDEKSGEIVKFPEGGGISSWNDKSNKESCLNLTNTAFITESDGYYIEVLITSVIGLVWIFLFKKYIYYIDSVDKEEWFAEKSDKRKEKSRLD